MMRVPPRAFRKTETQHCKGEVGTWYTYLVLFHSNGPGRLRRYFSARIPVDRDHSNFLAPDIQGRQVM
jgi:hypothetical protein